MHETFPKGVFRAKEQSIEFRDDPDYGLDHID